MKIKIIAATFGLLLSSSSLANFTGSVLQGNIKQSQNVRTTHYSLGYQFLIEDNWSLITEYSQLSFDKAVSELTNDNIEGYMARLEYDFFGGTYAFIGGHYFKYNDVTHNSETDELENIREKIKDVQAGIGYKFNGFVAAEIKHMKMDDSKTTLFGFRFTF